MGAPAPAVLTAFLSALALALAAPAGADAGPHYDVPPGYTRCPGAEAWHGFFKWASAEHASCRAAARFMRAYAAHAGDRMPTRVDGFRCRIHYWRNEDGDIYASRHTCARGREIVRFYGMV
ncbi:hypothetical protein [Candidatus Solirubrobacter pratensis]|uniref:hypothetical protein n=1 Tax=Candidatus Solirubrobacter pratensis TaxID=1298857 RepID=UPI000409C4FB|nr:hypothetical protein [Candidatus Solirubrobacter pratensis]